MHPIVAAAVWGLVEAGVWTAASKAPRLWGSKSDEETQLEAKKANKAAMREFRQALELENKRADAKGMRAQGAALELQSAMPPTPTQTPMMEPPSDARMLNPFEGQEAPTAAGPAPFEAAPAAPGPTAQMLQKGGFPDKLAALQQFAGTDLLANKLVSAALARGEQPTHFDYAGILI